MSVIDIVSKIVKLWNTTRYLKSEQILYQLKYRILGFNSHINRSDIGEINKLNIHLYEIDDDDDYIKKFQPDQILNNHIILINESQHFQFGVWNYPQKSHLWNFNLHYFEYAIALGGAYKKTKDEKYYNKFKELYLDWVTSNLVGKGDAWHPYTISLRIINLFVSMDLFDEQLIKDKEFQWKLLYSIWNQYLFLKKNQEKHLQGNHLFENIKTLYISSIYFRDEKGEKIFGSKLEQLISEQILPDGVHYERSFLYHNLILEGLFRVMLAMRQSGKDDCKLFRDIERTILEMSVVIKSVQQIMGKIPLFNDSAENIAKSERSLIRGIEDIYGQIEGNKKEFIDSGYYILSAQSISILFDAGIIGPNYIPGHGHCDALSFELSVNQNPVFINSGTYQYQGKLRNYFRSTKAHNTVLINEEEQAELWGEHRVARRFSIERCKYDKVRNSVEAVCKNYRGNKHSRKITIKNNIVIIEDKVEGVIKKDVRSYLHIHPLYECTSNGNKVEIRNKNNKKKMCVLWNDSIEKIIIHSDSVSELCIYSENFGELQKKEALEMIWKENINKNKTYIKFYEGEERE